MIGRIDDPRELEGYLRRDPALHLYELGDLDPFFWPSTTWWGRRGASGLDALALVYRGPAVSTLIALDDRHPSPIVDVLAAVAGALPDRLHAHVSPGVLAGLTEHDVSSGPEPYLRMALTRTTPAEAVKIDRVRQLGVEDSEAVEGLLAVAYPDNWLDVRMLETGGYTGIYDDGHLIAVAGVHVVSERTRVAALGNIATHPSWRRRGHARMVIAGVVRFLSARADTIGLNVAASNEAAIRCYESLGFRVAARYEEVFLSRMARATNESGGMS